MLSKKTPAYQRRVERMVAENLRLVHFVVHRTYPYADAEAREELTSVGNIALVKSAKTFDPDYGVAFSTYACTIIKRDLIAFMAIYQRQGMGRGRHAKNITSLDAHSREVDAPLDRMLADEPTSSDDDIFDGKLATEHLKRLMPREQKIIQLRFFDGLCLQETSRHLGISKERVRQIQERCLRKLRQMFMEKEDEENT